MARAVTVRRDTAWAAAALCASIVAGFLMTIVGARVLSVEEFAAVNWLLSWLLYAAAMVRLGTLQSSTMLAARRPTAARTICVRLYSGVLVTVALGGVLWNLSLADVVLNHLGNGASFNLVVQYFMYWLPAAALTPVVAGTLRGLGDFRTAAIIGEYIRRTTITIVLVVGAITTVSWGSLEVALISAIVAEWVALAIGLARIAQLTPGSVAALVGQPWRDSLGFIPISIGAVLVPHGSVWLLGFVANETEVAVLVVGLQVSLFFLVPFNIGSRVLAPRIARASEMGALADIEPVLRRFSTIALLFTICCLLFFALVGQSLISLAFGEKFIGAWPIVMLLGIAGLVNAGTGLCQALLSNSGYARIVGGAATVFGGLFVLLVLLFGSRWGAVGAASAAAIAVASQNFILARISLRLTGVRSGAASRYLPCIYCGFGNGDS